MVRELQENSDLALVFGFHPLHLPQVENFSTLLRDTENRVFQGVRDSLVSKLIEFKRLRELFTPLSEDSRLPLFIVLFAHITIFLGALTTAKTGNKDKVRFIKSFLPNI